MSALRKSMQSRRMSAAGPLRHFAAMRNSVGIGAKRTLVSPRPVDLWVHGLGGVLINDQCPLSPADNGQQRTCYSVIWRTTEENAYVERVQGIQANRFARE